MTMINFSVKYIKTLNELPFNVATQKWLFLKKKSFSIKELLKGCIKPFFNKNMILF